MKSILARLGGRKFTALLSATVALVALYAFGLELSDQTLDAIVVMYVAFAGGNGLEHIAAQLGRRAEKPALSQLPADISERVREAIDDGADQ